MPQEQSIGAETPAEPAAPSTPVGSKGNGDSINTDRAQDTSAEDPSGEWRPDPTRRHEGRWFVGGEPTRWVRDGGVRAEDATDLDPHDTLGGAHRDAAGPAALPYGALATEQALPQIATDDGRESKSRIKVLALIGAVAAAAIVAVIVITSLTGPTKKSRYLDNLDAAGLRSTFPSSDLAVSHAENLCKKLERGRYGLGTRVDKIGVEAYCPKLLPKFELKDNTYLDKLEAEGLNGEFGTHAEAIAHAQKVCRGLKNGEQPQGEQEDAIGVEVYCPQFSDGFKILRTITVDGVFLLDDSDSLAYSDPEYFSGTSGVETIGEMCYGQGGYSDIGPGTAVTVKNAEGDLLTTTDLGVGSSVGQGLCKFTFSFQIKEGEGTYVVSVSHRGESTYTFDDLESSGVQLSLGG